MKFAVSLAVLTVLLSIQSSLGQQRTCGDHATLKYCRSPCPSRCPPPARLGTFFRPAANGPFCQREVCFRSPACVCDDGYVRHNGQCILRSDCPEQGRRRRTRRPRTTSTAAPVVTDAPADH